MRVLVPFSPLLPGEVTGEESLQDATKSSRCAHIRHTHKGCCAHIRSLQHSTKSSTCVCVCVRMYVRLARYPISISFIRVCVCVCVCVWCAGVQARRSTGAEQHAIKAGRQDACAFYG